MKLFAPAARLSALLAAVTLPAGCMDVPVARYNAVQQQLLEAQESNRNLEGRLADQESDIRNLQEQVISLRRIEAPLEDLVTPVKIELERMSGGYDGDNKAGDEGIVLYIQPVDADGTIIKAAGTIKATLYDLQNPPAQHVIAEYYFDAGKTRSMWFGRLMTNHFTVRLPFPHTPAHDRITAEVIFTDLLTGRPLHAQGVYTIKLPPAQQATARP